MKVGIVGYGKMGQSIFKLIFEKNHEVTVVLRSEEKVKTMGEKFFKRLERSLKRSNMSPDDIQREIKTKRESYQFTHELSDLTGADLVIETVYEDVQLKLKLFNQLEQVVGSDTVLVTNSSSVSINKISKFLNHKDRFCGFHFFHPIMFIDLIEIIKGRYTSDNVIHGLKRFARDLGKNPVVVQDGPGSVINGVLTYYYSEAAYLLEEGYAKPSEIDEAASRYFYVGPCESIDVIGIDLFVDALENAPAPGEVSIVPIRIVHSGEEHLSNEDLGGREGFYYPPLLSKLIGDERLGKKVSRGVFMYEKGRALDDDPSYYLNPQRSGLVKTDNGGENLIRKRLLYSLFNGSLWALQHRMGSEEDLDLGMKEILQMSDGPLTMMRKMGFAKVKSDFEFLFENVGRRFNAPALESFFRV
jgi:3-hydroxybutyryl-CoA dehydrogenase